MTSERIWYVPSKSKGDTLKDFTQKWDENLMQAIKEICVDERAKHGYRISPPVLLHNLATQRGEYYTEVRRRLKKRHQQLNKEHQRELHTKQTQQEAAIGATFK